MDNSIKMGRRAVVDSNPIVFINGSDRESWCQTHLFVLAFGAYGSTRLAVYAEHLQDALDASIDWLVENAPGHICDTEVNEAYGEAILKGFTPEVAQEMAEADTTCGGNCGNHILSYEWFVIAEDPSRADLLGMMGRGAR